ncbi:MBL fold metallo-hydrolase [Rhizobium sp. KVB221]|uniref:MBL fold metallo-hydrolase n=1 Tax=Rhizobium setariae TaxID=2801340 RepID=A0A936YPF0_9HYPH|nr:MBL fold metallo-hydrolase [Rhizobium setariae]MBL0374260.1 MBL fold metallo-hydrolase [Rhizobium setariae]
MTERDLGPSPRVDAATIRTIARGVWVIPDHRVPLVPNIGIVEGTDAVLVIDTGMGNANGRTVLEAARKIAGDRPIWLTITHFHPEHGYGADAFKGNARILYNRSQVDDLAAKGEAYLGMFRGMGAAVAAALENTQLVAADDVYEGPRHELDLGGRKVVLRTWGRAHTNGDQIVYLPDEGVLFTGDLAEEKTFPIFPWFPPEDADIDATNWVKVLNGCLALAPKIVVPGHGDLGGAEILRDVRDYILDIDSRVGQAQQQQLAVDDMIRAIAPAVRAAHPDWHFPEWIDFAIRYFADQQQ